MTNVPGWIQDAIRGAVQQVGADLTIGELAYELEIVASESLGKRKQHYAELAAKLREMGKK